MQRRKFIAAIGTVGVGSGMALGTGAVDAVTSSNDSSGFQVVAPGADITITPAEEEGDNVIVEGDEEDDDPIDEDGIQFNNLEFADLPLVYVKNQDGMVTVQVAVERGSTKQDLEEVIDVTNNSDSTAYDIEFRYTGFGTKVGSDKEISEETATDAFKLKNPDGHVISTQEENDAPESLSLSPSSDTKTVSLTTDVSDETITDAVDDGTLGGDFESSSETLIDEVTARATEQ